MKRLSTFALLPLLALALRAAEPQAPLRVEDFKETIRVACIGDSITYGAGVEQRELNNYPAVLGRLLGDKFSVKNFGVSGATLLKKGDKPYWKEKAFTAATEFNPHVVVIKLGTNDTKPQNWNHKRDFLTDLNALIDHFAALPAKPRVYLCLPAPVYETKWGINEEGVKLGIIPNVMQVAKDRGLPTINLYSALSGKPEMFPDKIHPNAAGAKVMAETVARALMGK